MHGAAANAHCWGHRAALSEALPPLEDAAGRGAAVPLADHTGAQQRDMLRVRFMSGVKVTRRVRRFLLQGRFYTPSDEPRRRATHA